MYTKPTEIRSRTAYRRGKDGSLSHLQSSRGFYLIVACFRMYRFGQKGDAQKTRVEEKCTKLLLDWTHYQENFSSTCTAKWLVCDVSTKHSKIAAFAPLEDNCVSENPRHRSCRKTEFCELVSTLGCILEKYSQLSFI
jgi:hypothetical protein